MVIEIKNDKAERLQQLAKRRGIAENELIEEALDMLFRQTDRESILSEESELLSQLGTDLDLKPPYRLRPSLNPGDIRVLHSIPMRPQDELGE